mmetsp:Transcript_52495/g.145571  ORF Transcript_52495/g.145571 Transcript_52495/m.145571 type:complete len:246 (+) Transcript_52495:351-1088(+)
MYDTCSSWQSFGTTELTGASLAASTRLSGTPVAASTPTVQPRSACATPFSMSLTSLSTASPRAPPSLFRSGLRGTKKSTGVAHHSSKASLCGSAFSCAGRMFGFALALCCQKESFRERSSTVRTRGSEMSLSTKFSIGEMSLASASGTTAKQPQGPNPPGSSFCRAAACCWAQAAKSPEAFDFASATMSLGVVVGWPSSSGFGGVGAAKTTSRKRSSSTSVPIRMPKRIGVPWIRSAKLPKKDPL